MNKSEEKGTSEPLDVIRCIEELVYNLNRCYSSLHILKTKFSVLQVLNSIYKNSTCIALRLNCQTLCIQVVDNGDGLENLQTQFSEPRQ